MSDSLARLKEERDALMRSRLSGVRAVETSDGRRVEYRSDLELARALYAVNELIATAEGVTPPQTILFRTSKGL
ncbi:hypothetical protein E0493_05355 [Roseomonas sp. M0104]|uniref:Uncharacterized protein n=1 Tax=Teichococcus coralli TaxID=2545983 RepID=A0A845B9J8_9PROT|nr:hypothetical protein [Pseudoroseomonas coralli]MXP62776.1 hypothetical protein [Pseudoroseomonas coralli]